MGERIVGSNGSATLGVIGEGGKDQGSRESFQLWEMSGDQGLSDYTGCNRRKQGLDKSRLYTGYIKRSLYEV